MRLKVPKREIFVAEVFYTIGKPIWVSDLGTESKNKFL
jgi:hypothetical protein